jgi:hypothetical protein
MPTYTDRVAAGLEGLRFVSTGICPGCEECADMHGFESVEQMGREYETGSLCDEPHFSWSPCGICGSHLGGDREVWHWVDKDGAIIHEPGACVDCVMYLANGDIPEGEE